MVAILLRAVARRRVGRYNKDHSHIGARRLERLDFLLTPQFIGLGVVVLVLVAWVIFPSQ